MADLITEPFLTSFVAGVVAFGIPVLIAGIGQTVDQRAGVLDIGVEGTMLVGAYAGFAAAFETGSTALGFLGAIAMGIVVSLLLILLHIRSGLDGVVIGIATVIAAQGVTSVLFDAQYAASYPRLGEAPTLGIPVLSDIPILGPSLFDAHWVVYVSFIMVVAVAWMLRRTKPGLDLRAAGDNPEAADRSGVSVIGTRTAAHVFAGAMSGLAGGYMVLISAGVFVPFMVNGAGFVALMITMLARGRPFLVLLGSMLFGTAVSLVTALQLGGVDIPTDLVQLLPFAFLIALLFTFAGRAGLPPYLGRPYERGAR